ncbi:MAG: response regulator [Deltaproteobacteria bacterium]|nr:response regulator [Deltaproteobacteria bacterium]
MSSNSAPPGLQIDALQLLTDLAEAMLIVERPERTILATNPRCEDVTGYGAGELVGGRLDLLAAERVVSRVPPLDFANLLSRPGLHEEVPLRRRDGSHFVASVHVSVSEDPRQQIALLLLRDQTARLMLERELITKHMALREAYQDLERMNSEITTANAELKTTRRHLMQLEKMATIGKFAAGVAHEVNNPMTFVLQNLQLLQSYAGYIVPIVSSHLARHGDRTGEPGLLEEIRGELHQVIDETLQGADRVSRLVKQLHAFSNVSDQAATLTDLRQILETSIMMVQNQIRYRARLERHFFETPRVVCVPGQISQVLVNLLVNAMQALEGRDFEGNVIVVRLSTRGDMILLEVEDNGCGIAPEHLGRVLDPFFTTKPAGKGTGLGLALSASVVHQHGGTIEVESQLGTGTTVRVLLPIQSPHKVGTRITDAVEPVAHQARILLVDDEETLLRASQRSFGRQHQVRTALGPNEALLRLAEDSQVDLVLSDLMMPDMDGLSLCREILVRYPHLKGRVMLMTGGVFTDAVQAEISASGLQVLRKPFDGQDLQRALSAVGGPRLE